jgi:hypothetical protein
MKQPPGYEDKTRLHYCVSLIKLSMASNKPLGLGTHACVPSCRVSDLFLLRPTPLFSSTAKEIM